MENKTSIGVAVVGAGTVGGGVLDMLREQRDTLRRRCGRALEVSAVVRRDAGDTAGLGDFAPLLTTDWRAAVNNPATDIVLELMGGTGAADECIRAALAAGKPVVTANKALLAERSGGADDLLAAAAAARLPLAREAAIAGCIPVVKTLREALAGDRVNAVFGVINGTCNYILTAMESRGMAFEQALAQAQELGYAEADPALDIDGMDAAHKLLLIARMAFGAQASMSDVAVQGVRNFDRRDIEFAAQFGYRVKLLAVAKRVAGANGAEQVEMRVRPAMLPAQHAMAAVEGAMNVATVHAHYSGETMYVGAGAGAHPTAVAVLADVVDIARRYGDDGYHHIDLDDSDGSDDNAPVAAPAGALTAPHYLRLRVIDKPGVIADVSRQLADHGVSIEAMHQSEAAPDSAVDIVILLHEADASRIAAAAAAIESLPAVTEPAVAIPIEKLQH